MSGYQAGEKEQMPKCDAKLQTWQIFHAILKTLGPTKVVKLWGTVKERSVYMYAQNPATSQDRSRDPLENLHATFSEMALVGRSDVVQCAIAFLLTAIKPLEHLEAVKGLKPTICEEILEDFVAVARLQAAIASGEPVEVVEREFKEAQEELERTMAKYWQGHGRS